METAIIFFTSHPIGITLLCTLTVGFIIIIILSISKGYSISRDKDGKLSWDKKENIDSDTKSKKRDQKENSSDISKNAVIRIDNIVDNSIKDLLVIKNKYREENRKTQREALKKAIGSITLSYTKTLDNDDNIQKRAEILELYLKRDFNQIMSEKLDDIRKSNENGTIKKDDILNNISKYTESVMTDIKSVAYKFDLIDDKNSLQSLFEESKTTIRDTLEEVIKQFVNLNDNEQKEILEIRNKRLEQIKQEFQLLLEQ
jgi:hypothetical protein